MTNTWTVDLIEDDNGDIVLPFPDDLIEKCGWYIGDKLNLTVVGESIIITNLTLELRKAIHKDC